MAADDELPPWPDDEWGRHVSHEGFGHRLLWARPRHMVELHPRIEQLDAWQALRELERWASDPFARLFLEQLHHREHGPPFGRDGDDAWGRVLSDLASDLEAGRLVLHAVRQDAPPPGTIPVSPARPRIPGRAAPLQPTAWIEVHLVDESDRVVADEPVTVVDPLGARHHLTTDEHGLARLGGIEPGTCDVSFPRIDGREWARKGAGFPPGSEVVATEHVVHPRECMSRIARRFAFRSPDTLWRHDCNAPIRELGRSPDVLWPGDRINILARDDRFEEAATGRRHHFVVKTAVRWLRLVLHDVFRRPLGAVPYVLTIRGLAPTTGSTGPDGLLEEVIPPSATEATITAGEYGWKVAIADLLPVEQVPDDGREGVRRRLCNLGCSSSGEATTQRSLDTVALEPEPFDADVFMHQLRVGWSTSGELDQPTRQRVLDEYGT